jgi:hypothetical protein
MSNLALKQESNIVEIRSPYALIESAVASGASVETLERLMTLQERFDKTQAAKAFIAAMQRFQTIKPELPKVQEVSYGAGKTAYKFCPLPEIDKRLREPLQECGLSYRFENDDKLDTGDIGVRCIVTHSDGHSESTTQYAKADQSGNKNPVQAMASTRTYLMRYCLIAAFGLTTADEDDDGQSAGDMPYNRLLQHNAALRENLKVVLAIKEAIAEKDYYQVAMYMDNMKEDVRNALWLAPSKGGAFTTAEIAVFRSNEYASARADYFAEKQK